MRRRRHAGSRRSHGPAAALALALLSAGCGGTSSEQDARGGSANSGSANAGSATSGAANAGSATSGAANGGSATTGGSAAFGGSSNGGAASAGGRCTEPSSAAPDPGPFEAPQVDSFGTYEVSFENRCEQAIWPAWGPSGGLVNSVIPPQLWSAMPPHSERKVTVYGGLRDIGFWGRTSCSFDEDGQGACATGDCGGFVCSLAVNSFPTDATVFEIAQGFSGGYNVSLRVSGEACGSHECAAELDTCPDASVVRNECSAAVACLDVCGSRPQCCSGAPSRCAGAPSADASGDLVLTFCP